MQVPLGVNTSRPNQVCKLYKLYGLTQASWQWFDKLLTLLLQCGYTQSPSDHSLFLKHEHSYITTLLVYVEDIILARDSLEEFKFITATLDHHFRMKDLGQLKYFLRLEMAQFQVGIPLYQHHYCLNLLANSGLLGCKRAQTPFDYTQHLHQDATEIYADAAGYRRLVGRFIYLTLTCPNICFAT